MQGKPISPGYGAGIAVVLDTAGVDAETCHPPHRSAREYAVSNVLSLDLPSSLNKSAGVYSTSSANRILPIKAHLAILNDPTFRDRRGREDRRRTRRRRICARSRDPGLCTRLAQVGDTYFASTNRFAMSAAASSDTLSVPRFCHPQSLPPRSVLAHKLLPSDTLNIDRSHLEAIVTEEEGRKRAMRPFWRQLGVPAVTGVEQLTRKVRPGTEMLVNGETGEVIISPLHESASQFASNAERWQQQRDQTLVEEKLPT